MAAATRRTSGPVLRSASPSPSGRFYSHRNPSSAFASSSAAAFSARTSSPGGALLRRPTSPTRVSLYNPAPSVRFSLLDRPSSPNRSVSVSNRSSPVVQRPQSQKRTCMCSPTNHPGSFRCSLHKGSAGNSHGHTASYSSNSNRLNMRRSAMKNSLVRIGTVEGGDWVKRALASLIRPSSHQQRRRDDFKPRPSRLSVMSKE
ncbi:OLC1v1038116C1 [Oldenlandia corymbosa var. corymbosa]|uniref:OLC1v1038116C1 n=1 Tax=Oldenlandia corymbosa var. corymbosa TaxID=529605 RepID=A0AAV1CZQ1_OLDCO|nr:OLC1v1038116C1 [Oldenlandia corymbosa var. corymbosa]